jgi:hypothetical protein
MEPGKTSGNIEFPTVCIAEQPDSEDTQLNVEEIEVQSRFSEDATSETQDPSPTYARAPKRKREKSTLHYQEEMVRLEKRKLEWLNKQQEEENDEDLHFFRSLVPHIKQLPPARKLFLRSQFQNMVADEITALQNN